MHNTLGENSINVFAFNSFRNQINLIFLIQYIFIPCKTIIKTFEIIEVE